MESSESRKTMRRWATLCALPSASSLLPSASCLLLSAFCLLLSAFCLPAFAQSLPRPSSPLYGGRPENGPVATGLPKALQNVGIDQKLNQQVPLDLVLRDENGEQVKLGQYFGKRPVVLSLVYYSCPMLCTQVLNGMAGAFKALAFIPGEEYEVVTVSFDPRETPALAAAKKTTYVNYLPEAKRAGASNGWHFLTADEENIKRLTEAVGFRYHWDQATEQFAHASGIMVLTPQGKLAQYYYGIEYSPKDLRLGLVEASANKIGTTVDQLLLYCYHYDPATGKYGAVVMNMVRLGGLLTIAAIIILLLVLRRRGAARIPLSAGGAV
jgi:protein SCO1/2